MAVGSREQPLGVHQHPPAVEAVGIQQQRRLPGVRVLLAAGAVHDAVAVVVGPGVLPSPGAQVPGAPVGPVDKGRVAGGKDICKNGLCR